MKNAPTISVIIPTYNRAKLLPRALDSIIAQTYQDWEIVVVDDGSTDNTKEVVQAYADKLGGQCQYVYQENARCEAARNRGIGMARGQFVAFLDSDDEFLPRKLEQQMELFKLRPELGFVYGDYAYIDLEGVRFESFFDTISKHARDVSYEEIAPDLCVCTGDLFDVLLRGYFVATIVGLVRREVLADSIRFSEQEPSYSAEWQFYLQIARKCQAGFVNNATCLHHYVAGSISRTDTHRNAISHRFQLLEIRERFSDMTRHQRKTIDTQLASYCRQLAFDDYKAADYASAARFFTEAVRFQPSFKTAWYAVQSMIAAFGKRGDAANLPRTNSA